MSSQQNDGVIAIHSNPLHSDDQGDEQGDVEQGSTAADDQLAKAAATAEDAHVFEKEKIQAEVAKHGGKVLKSDSDVVGKSKMEKSVLGGDKAQPIIGQLYAVSSWLMTFSLVTMVEVAWPKAWLACFGELHTLLVRRPLHASATPPTLRCICHRVGLQAGVPTAIDPALRYHFASPPCAANGPHHQVLHQPLDLPRHRAVCAPTLKVFR